MDQIPPPPSPPPLPPAVLPYAVPLTNQLAAAGGLWRDKMLLVTPTTARLPYVCVKCNAPTLEGTPGAKRLTQKFTWHHPLLYLLILPGVLIYAIVALILQKKATVELSLCPIHNRQRVHRLTFMWVTVIGGLALLAAGCAGGMSYAKRNDLWPAWLMLGGFLVAIVGGIVGAVMIRPLTPTRIDDHYAWFKGASPELLATLPGT